MIVISVSKGYQNAYTTLKYHIHRRAKTVWYAYLIDNDDKFIKKRISLIEVPIYKAQIRKKRVLICPECEKEFVAYVKNDKEKVTVHFAT